VRREGCINLGVSITAPALAPARNALRYGALNSIATRATPVRVPLSAALWTHSLERLRRGAWFPGFAGYSYSWKRRDSPFPATLYHYAAGEGWRAYGEPSALPHFAVTDLLVKSALAKAVAGLACGEAGYCACCSTWHVVAHRTCGHLGSAAMKAAIRAKRTCTRAGGMRVGVSPARRKAFSSFSGSNITLFKKHMLCGLEKMPNIWLNVFLSSVLYSLASPCRFYKWQQPM